MKTGELLSRGWAMIIRSDPELDDEKETSLATRMPGWGNMSWAQRTVHRAAYGFEDGELVIAASRMSDPETRLAVEHSRKEEEQGEEFALPGRALPGADERLRKILSGEASPEATKYDESAAAWRGTDGSVVYTCEFGWGVPDLVEQGAVPYYEFSGRGDLRQWQENYGQQPDWSIL